MKSLIPAAIVALAFVVPAVADDKPALTGTWMKGELRLEFADKGVLKISPHNKDELILLVCKYTVEKDGVVKVKITELEGTAKDMAKDHLPAGKEFTFKWQAKDDTATIDDMKGDDIDFFRSHLEGKYEKK